MYGYTIIRMVHCTLALQHKFPDKQILQSKIDYKSAYRRAHLNWVTSIQSLTQTDKFIHISLRATFGGAPNSPEWGNISESVTDLANILMSLPDWDPEELHSPIQHLVPPYSYLPDDIAIAVVLLTISPPS